jgi:hypothetical protein
MTTPLIINCADAIVLSSKEYATTISAAKARINLPAIAYQARERRRSVPSMACRT